MHSCEMMKQRRFKIVDNAGEEIGYRYGMYDQLSHTYLWAIFYCPFCGRKL
jgi:hypothetical protein